MPKRPFLSGILLFPVCLFAQQGPVAITDVTVVPMDNERLISHTTVIVKDGRITAMGPVRSTRPPKGTYSIDGRGKFLMPGLADMHVHLNIRGSAGLVKNEEYFTCSLPME